MINNNTWRHSLAQLAICSLTRVVIRCRWSCDMSIHRYFKPTVNLPTASQAQMPPSILKEVNQAVKVALQHEAAGNRASESTTHRLHPRIVLLLDDTQLNMKIQQLLRSLRPTHDVGESTVRLFNKWFQDEIKKLEDTVASEVRSLPKCKTEGGNWCWESN